MKNVAERTQHKHRRPQRERIDLRKELAGYRLRKDEADALAERLRASKERAERIANRFR